ncbi:class I SAM-dependent methyltransferase [Desulfosarcina ovata]|uniref:Methyltransferase type 11 domain-containing protein n=1 Tax=Desulfosarcina ovata subsp. ovata TaxID=2752305 RepID=A0A5K8AD30_9BACT|nr:methyltransferase domain-containing protein [Desulfosarcina ovata]BBO90398.1 hypothetical protein DSCOOX_35780 [Desulfosarcina ovata subsp. ovata]
MNKIDMDSIADIVFQLKWDSTGATHTECYAARSVNLWRDWLPDNVRDALMGRPERENITVDFSVGELFGSKSAPLCIDRQRFCMPPMVGRFYPRGRIRGLPGVFPQNMQPFRCVGINNGHMQVDLGHPLADYPLTLSMTVGQIEAKTTERGGSSVDWIGMLTEGPGMQARWKNRPTDFFSSGAFERKDQESDDRFYAHPRLVHHLDQTAREMVANVYKRFVRDGMRVLDLMSSWVSHLPHTVNLEAVHGLGMNRTELEQNPVLAGIDVQDLNTSPVLPYPDAAFDMVVNTVSVEYLIHPLEVFAEVGRVLKPGGTFVVTFSNRWFPTKAVRIWDQLHEFERMGLVMEYFLTSGCFHRFGTYSMRGLPRPRDDRYAGERLHSDPVYAVWGTKKESSNRRHT